MADADGDEGPDGASSTASLAHFEDEYDRLMLPVPKRLGNALSSDERKAKGLLEQSFIYGEIDFTSFARTLIKIKEDFGGLHKGGEVFVDLGSGVGKAVLGAAVVHPFSRCVGIEILESLHREALLAARRWEEHAASRPTPSTTVVDLRLGDFTTLEVYNWPKADVVFVNSTCFSAAVLERIVRLANAMRPGTWLISFTHALESAEWELLDSTPHTMSWGQATVHIMRRLQT